MVKISNQGKVRVEQFTNTNGDAVSNQFVIHEHGSEWFQSYQIRIARKSEFGLITLDTKALDYSKITSKYLFQFLGLTRKEIEIYIENRVFLVKDLN